MANDSKAAAESVTGSPASHCYRIPRQTFLIRDTRTLVWFSCGAASACAAKLAVERFDNCEVCYCDTLKYEHPDNRRFLRDVEAWIERPITRLHSSQFEDIYDVFESVRYLNGPSGAPCTRALKRNVRIDYQDDWDEHVFGYTVEEQARIERFEKNNPWLMCHWILRDRGITKRDCLEMIARADIEIPAMYRMGYRNNNCIGCVKGGAGYWNKIRVDFPDTFQRMAEMERKLDFALLKVKGEPCFLDELPPDVGRYDTEPDISCGPQCQVR